MTAAAWARANARGQVPQTSEDIVRDLHTALRFAKVQGPYVLVGHSIGGLHALNYARLYPAEVAGLVLVSSSHPNQLDSWRKVFPPHQKGEVAAVTTARDFLLSMDKDPSLNPERLDIGLSNAQARKLTSLGSKPVIVVTHSPSWKMVPNLPDALNAKLELETQRLQRQFLTLSRQSQQRIAQKAGHDIPNEDPDLVVRSTLDAVALARGAKCRGIC